jgi:fumarate reductase subunit D
MKYKNILILLIILLIAPIGLFFTQSESVEGLLCGFVIDFIWLVFLFIWILINGYTFSEIKNLFKSQL